MPPSTLSKAIHFGPFAVTSQVFYRTPLSFCLVNLKPLLPGHILVCPLRRVQHIDQLSANEVTDLFSTVQLASRTLKRVYNASACNIAIQDGKAAGQSVPHVHAHLIPRKGGDMDAQGGGDKIYEQLEGDEGDVGRHQRDSEGMRKAKFPKVEDDKRKPRSMEEMEKEARWLAEEMQKDAQSFSNESSV
ncbi:bis-tetraphosphatase [Aureobasidium subglaciale]|nr:bis-tetraphosphatase [Aureobasidium subglaciale]